jgi:hypothetical protein
VRTEYTDWVGENLRCCVSGCQKLGGHRAGTISDPHHVRTKGALGKQVDDCNVVPLCYQHHEEGHRIGWQTFARRYRVCLPAVALFVFSRFELRRCSSRYYVEDFDLAF